MNLNSSQSLSNEALETLIKRCIKETLEELFDDLFERLDNSKTFPDFTLDEAQKLPKNAFLSRKQTAKLLQVSLVTLHKWTTEGDIKAHRIGNTIRYRPDDIDDALKQVQSLKYKRHAHS